MVPNDNFLNACYFNPNFITTTMDHQNLIAATILAGFFLCVSVLSLVSWRLHRYATRSGRIFNILGCFRPILGLATLPPLIISWTKPRSDDALIWCAILAIMCSILSEVSKSPLVFG